MSIDLRKSSYHEVAVFVDGKRYGIWANYAYDLRCTRAGGWELWWVWNGRERRIGGEFDGKPFRIEICGVTVFDSELSDDE